MELYMEILAKILEKEELFASFPNFKINLNELFELECYKTLQKIKSIIEDDNLDDTECFMRIENIVCAFEEIGSDGGNRHDFS